MKDVFVWIHDELNNALKVQNHPFRFFTLGTTNLKGFPSLRTVVLRDIDKELNISIYTDSRSPKIEQIQNQHITSSLFYDPINFVQLRIDGTTEIIANTEQTEKLWLNMPEKSKKDYTTIHPPSKEKPSQEPIVFFTDKNFFSILKIKPCTIEYLKLGRSNHTRILFKKEKEDWKSTLLIP